ncbi:T-cell ecto-ADP-ribosyltransferase 2-like [Cavia porcellus]|uniref:T-cell ecto-ADP-ribosyltransferase 2-like n=1 Tax=Cavia porcellus TaxID=10141 RepID=UPI000350D4F3|nr:T-cell ecto-ADP-ribosyltransferase 2-like [Cavia porcellus]
MTSLLYIAIHIFMLNWWLTQQVTALTESKLDMAYDAFDDQYEGCIQEMEKKAPQLLKEELNINKNLKSEWTKAEKYWEKIKNKVTYPKNFNDFHGIALVTYTGDIATDFNKAVREFRQNSDNFWYKAFHYYLTRALQLLKDQNCYKVYTGTSTKFYYSGKGSVRFGQFTSSSLNKEAANNFLKEGGTLFKINTCLGVPIKISFFEDEEEVLIPGYEVYNVASIETTKKGNTITLKDPRRQKSNYNCFYLSNRSGMIKGPESLVLLLPTLLILLLLHAEL